MDAEDEMYTRRAAASCKDVFAPSRRRGGLAACNTLARINSAQRRYARSSRRALGQREQDTQSRHLMRRGLPQLEQ